MRTVFELTQEELEELRETYFEQLESDVLDDIDRAEDIPMDVIMNHYEGISFCSDDFFCNL